MIQVAVGLDNTVSTEAGRRKFYRFFTAFQQHFNALLSMQLLRLGSMIALYETDELEAVYWYLHYLHRDLDQWKEQLDGGLAFLSLFSLSWSFSVSLYLPLSLSLKLLSTRQAVTLQPIGSQSTGPHTGESGATNNQTTSQTKGTTSNKKPPTSLD
jgi:hypothetical protein